MKNKKVLIYDEDVDYSRHLADYIGGAKEFSGCMQVVSKKDTFLEQKESDDIQAVLVGENVYHEIWKDKILLVLEEEQGSFPDCGIFKYQKAENILNKLKSVCGLEDIENSKITQYGTMLLGVFSPCGGSGKTTFSLALGQILGKEKKTLYISLEDYPSIEGSLFESRYDGHKGLSELLYYEHNEERKECLQRIVCGFGNMDCVMPVKHYKDLFDVDSEKGVSLLEWLRENSGYDVVIFDMGSLMEYSLPMMEKMDSIYLVRWDNPNGTIIDEVKRRVFQNYMEMDGRTELAKKMIPVTVPKVKEIRHCKEYFEGLENTSLGDFIKRCVIDKESGTYGSGG